MRIIRPADLINEVKAIYDSPDLYYERLKQYWIAKHPEATPREYEQAMRECAEKAGV